MPIEREVDTIIIGGGISGLACAKKLQEYNKEFLLITKDIGGRILSSKDGNVNYGAYFVLKNYHNILPYIKKKERMHPLQIGFHWHGKNYHLIRMMKHPIETIRFIITLKIFKKKYEKFKILCLNKSQKEVIESDEYYKSLYFQTAEEFIKNKKFEKITEKFLSEGIYMCTFEKINKISALDFLRLCTALIIPAYEFEFLKNRLIDKFKDKIKIDVVTSIKDKKIKTKKGLVYKTKNLVIATPPKISKKLLGLRNIKKPSNCFGIHLLGELKKKSGQYELFPNRSEIIFIRKQQDGSYIVYSKIKKIDLKRYFTNPRVINIQEWKPAFHTYGKIIWKSNSRKDTYLIGDHNLIGMEDAFITGIYAANQIIKSSSNNSQKQQD